MEERDTLPGAKVGRLDPLDHFPRRAARSSVRGGLSVMWFLNASGMAGSSLDAGECLPFNMKTAKVFYHIAHVYNRTDLT